MGTVIYKKLVEIQVLHEYYLAPSDESSFFDASDADQKARLNSLLARSAVDVRELIDVIPTDETARQLGNHRIRLISTPLGFFLAAEVEKVDDGGVEKLRLKIPLPAAGGTSWKFRVEVRDASFISATNDIHNEAMKTKYFFSNDNTAATKAYPSLALPVEPFTLGNTYAMGSLAIIAGSLKQAEKKTASASSGWVTLPNDHRWVSREDRLLLPTRFSYVIQGSGITEVNFTLSDTFGTPLINLSSTDPSMQRRVDTSGDLVELLPDFTRMDDGSGGEIDLPPGQYLLEVEEVGSPAVEHTVVFDNSLYGMQVFAGITLNPGEPDADFQLIDTNGFLVRRPDGSHPLFQIRLLNRRTYWRYYSMTARELEAKNKATLFLDDPMSGLFLQTKQPKSLQQEPVYFVDGADKIFLPNPLSTMVKPETDGNMYSDIFLSEVKGLIENKI